MANLLVLADFPDKAMLYPGGVFVYHQVVALKRCFDRVFVISPLSYAPRILSPLARFSPRLGRLLAAEDYEHENVKVLFPRHVPWVSRSSWAQRTQTVLPCILHTIERERLAFDLVHAHMTLYGWYAAQLAHRFSVPSVLTCHENHDWLMALIDQADPILLTAWRECDTIIRVTPFDIPQLAAAAQGRPQIVAIPNGFDTHKVPAEPGATLRTALGLPPQRPILVSVARWIPRKDPLILVEAMRRIILSGRRPEPLLLLIGEDGMGGQIQHKISAGGLTEHVHLLGKKTPADVLRYMRAATAVVLYSHSEGNPTVMFEALGCGRPYIGSDVGGVRSVLADPRLGLYGPPGEVDTLVALLNQALDTEWDERFIMEQAAQYTWDNIARRIYEEVYQPLLAGPPGSRSAATDRGK